MALRTIDDIIKSLDGVRAQIKYLEQEESRYESEAVEVMGEHLRKQFEGKDYGCGTANIETSMFDIKVVVSKKVKYDQKELQSVSKKLQAMGQDVSEYIKTKLEVSETNYNAWPTDLKKLFIAARTVEPSKPKIEIKRKAE